MALEDKTRVLPAVGQAPPPDRPHAGHPHLPACGKPATPADRPRDRTERRLATPALDRRAHLHRTGGTRATQCLKAPRPGESTQDPALDLRSRRSEKLSQTS